MKRLIVLMSGFAMLAIAAATPVSGTDPSDNSGDEVAARAYAEHKPVSQVATEEARREQGMPLGAAAKADAEHFAGAWFDDEGYLHIAFVGREPYLAVARQAPQDLLVDWVPVLRSYNELQAIRTSIFEQGRTPEIGSISVSAQRNEVVVNFVSTPDVSLEQQLAAQYGDAVSFAVEPPSEDAACQDHDDNHNGDRRSCFPTRGAIVAQVLPNNNDNYHGTYTMRAKRSDAYICYLITAGHAGGALGGNWLTSQDFYHGGTFIGTSTVNSLTLSHPNSDARRVPTTCDSTVSNRIYMDNSNRSFPITGIRNWSAQLNGMTVCKTGTSEDTINGVSLWGLLCGKIVDDNTTFTNPDTGKTVYWAIQGDFSLDTSGADGVGGGDSGAPVFSSGLLYGDAAKSNGKYSTPDWIQNDLSVLFCTNADCSTP